MNTNTRLEIRIGADVDTLDGVLGRLHQVVVDPGDARVTALVVRQGHLRGQDYVVPLAWVDDASDDLIRLGRTTAEVQSSRSFAASDLIDFFRGDRDGQRVAPGQATFSHRGWSRDQAGTGEASRPVALARARVACLDGQAGMVKELLLDDTGRVRQFVIDRGGPRHEQVIAPVAWVKEAYPNQVVLDVKREEVDRLPEYQSDRDLQYEVDGAVWADEIIRNTVLPYRSVELKVRDGVVQARGHVHTWLERSRIANIIRGVPGVLGVENRLIDDEHLVLAVADALAQDECTWRQAIQVRGWMGYVRLTGTVPDETVRQAAEQVTAGVRGVRAVLNALDTADGSLQVEQPVPPDVRIGDRVYADDADVGEVCGVVLDPRTRRLMTLVVESELPRPEEADPNRLPDEWPKAEREIAIPVTAIDRATAAAVFLSLDAYHVAKLPGCDRSRYRLPGDGWEPPFPFEREDVLLEAEPGRITRPHAPAG